MKSRNDVAAPVAEGQSLQGTRLEAVCMKPLAQVAQMLGPQHEPFQPMTYFSPCKKCPGLYSSSLCARARHCQRLLPPGAGLPQPGEDTKVAPTDLNLLHFKDITQCLKKQLTGASWRRTE